MKAIFTEEEFTYQTAQIWNLDFSPLSYQGHSQNIFMMPKKSLVFLSQHPQRKWFLTLWIMLLIPMFYFSGITHNAFFFFVWLFSLNMFWDSFMLLLFSFLNGIPLCEHAIIYLPILLRDNLGCCQFFVIINQAAINWVIQSPRWTCFYFSWINSLVCKHNY